MFLPLLVRLIAIVLLPFCFNNSGSSRYALQSLMSFFTVFSSYCILLWHVCYLVILSLHNCGCSRYALQSLILNHRWFLFKFFLCNNLGMATMIHLLSTVVLLGVFSPLSPIATPRPILVYYFMFCITTLHHHINVLTTTCFWSPFARLLQQ